MESNEFKKFWNSASDALNNSQETAKILKSFNDVIHGLYFLGSEEEYIFSVLNTTTYQDEEYKRLTESIGIELTEIADKLELMRSILFGDCFNWDNVYNEFEKFLSE